MDVTVIAWRQERTDPFQDAEFYENGIVVTVSGPTGIVEVSRDGESLLKEGAQYYRTPAEFRAAFPTGKIPVEGDGAISWTYNGWFDLYDGVTGDHLDAVSYTLDEAVEDAKHVLKEWEHRDGTQIQVI